MAQPNWAPRPDEKEEGSEDYEQDSAAASHGYGDESSDSKSAKPKPNDTSLTERSDAKGKATKETDDLEAQYAQPSYKGDDAGDNQKAPADVRATNAAAAVLSKIPGAVGGAARAWKGMSGRKKGAIGAGSAVGIVSLIMGAYFAFLPLKLGMLMENMFKHHFQRSVHSYEVRQRAIMKVYFKTRFDPTFDANKQIVNYDRSVFQNLYSKLRDSDLEDRLQKAGYKIKYEPGKSGPRHRILTITQEGVPGELDAGNFNREYDLRFEKPEARSQLKQIREELTHGESWFKRLSIKHRLTVLTGTKWHWLDPITQPLAKARIKVANEITTYILTKSTIARTAAAKLLTMMTGGKVSDVDAASISDNIATETAAREATEEVTEKVAQEILAKSLVGTISELSNPVGWVVLVVGVGCTLQAIETNGFDQLSTIAKDKANAEYMIAYSAYGSKFSQLKDGLNTNGTAVAASMEMLTDKQGRDIGQSNNYLRATGQDVAYKHSDNCNNGEELCDAKRPNSMIAATTLGKALKAMQDISDSDFKYVPGAPGNIYGTALCKILMPILDFANMVVGKALTITLNIMTNGGWGDLMDKAGTLISDKVMQPLLTLMIPPVVNADTRGPKLANAIAAGADASNSASLRTMCGDAADSQKCLMSKKEVAEISYAAESDEHADFQRLAFWDKLFSTDNRQSMVSKLAVAIPASPRVVLAKLASIGNLFQVFTTSPFAIHNGALAFAGMTSPATVAAAGDEDPLGVDQYGYNETCLQDAKLNSDDKDSGCKDKAGNAISIQPLDVAVACTMTAGLGASDDDMDEYCATELDSATPTGGTTVPTDPTGSLPTGNLQSLAKQILANNNISFDSSQARLPIEQLAGGAKTVSTYLGRNTDVNIRILQLMLYIAQNHTYRISDITMSDAHWTRDLSCPGSHALTHCAGAAFDIGYYDGNDLNNTGSNPVAIKLVQNIIPVIPTGSNINMGDSSCGGPFSSKIDTQGKKIISDADACNHIHIALPW